MKKELDVILILRDIFGNVLLTDEEADKNFGISDVIARERGHRQMKFNLGGRVQVLRVLVHKYFRLRQENSSEWEYYNRCEKYIDNILSKKNYRIEPIIDEFRLKVKKEDGNNGCHSCKYSVPFCKHYDYDKKIFGENNAI